VVILTKEGRVDDIHWGGGEIARTGPEKGEASGGGGRRNADLDSQGFFRRQDGAGGGEQRPGDQISMQRGRRESSFNTRDVNT